MPVGVATDRTSISRGNRRMVEVGMRGARVRGVTDRARLLNIDEPRDAKPPCHLWWTRQPLEEERISRRRGRHQTQVSTQQGGHLMFGDKLTLNLVRIHIHIHQANAGRLV